MPIDPSILFRLERPFNPLDSISRAAQTRLLQNQARFSDIKLADLLRLQGKEKALDSAARAAYQVPAPVTTSMPAVNVGGVNIPGRTSTVQGPPQFDRQQFVNRLSQSDPLAAVGYQSQFAAQDSASAKAGLDLREQLQRLSKNELDMSLTRINAANQAVGSVLLLPPEQRAPAYAQVVQQLKQRGWIDPNHPDQYPGDDVVKSELAQGMKVAEQFKLAQTQAELFEKNRHNQELEQETGRHHRAMEANVAATNQRMRDQNDIARQQKQKQQDLQNQDALQSFDESIQAAKDLRNHPGLSTVVGVKGITGYFPVGGTDAADFKAKLDTFRSKLFIPMVSKLKGMGQLSDAEGKKLTQAAGALDERMPEKSFSTTVVDRSDTVNLL